MEQNPNAPTEETIFPEEEFSMEGYDKHIRNARIMLYVLAGFSLFALFLVLPLNGDPIRIITAVAVVVYAGIYVGLGFWAKKKPYTALLIALIFFVGIQVIGAIINPASIIQGWFIKILIIVMLVLGLRNAKESQRMMELFKKKQ